jgi:CDP-paratose 2-epimerase
MPVAIVTGSSGLVGSSAVRLLSSEGFDVVGIDNDMRAYFFGSEASTEPTAGQLVDEIPSFRWLDTDIRSADEIDRIFAEHASALELIVHAAAQPSHDWAAREPRTDWAINAEGTLNLLESARVRCPDATFAFISTNKVYGDLPNQLPLEEGATRLDLPPDHRYFNGIDSSMSIDRSTHSLFGASKAAADLLVQEYGRYFGMPTVCFRCGCITGPAHAGAELHGFLAYMLKAAAAGIPYTVFGYGGKQVRDNLHALDLAEACLTFHRNPRPGAVYNIGGGRGASCSVIEAIDACERIARRQLDWELSDRARIGDHRWWISDQDEFRIDYPDWSVGYDVPQLLGEIFDANADRWGVGAR